MQASHDKARFVLREPSSNTPTPIILLYRYKSNRLKYATSEKVLPADWDSKLQRAQTNQRSRFLREPFEGINAQLERYQSALKRIIAKCKLAQLEPTVERVKEFLDQEFGRTPTPPPDERSKAPTFFEFTEQFLDDCKTGKRLTSQNRRYTLGTVKNYTTTFNRLKEYQKVYPTRLDFDAFTLTFYGKFKKYLTSQGFAVNTIGNFIKNVKIFLKESYRDELHQNETFRHEDFKKIQEETESIYLGDDELQKMYALDLSKTPGLDNVRDAFLIGCYTGLRFSDFSQLKPENIIHGGRILTVETQKTRTRVYIPLNPNVLAICSKYADGLPRVISNQKFNEHLKEIAKRAGLKAIVQVSVTKGGMRITKTVEKWNLVTSHTARRSFATNAYLAGVPTLDIMKITGHKTETSFMKYIKVSKEETALRMLAHPHFQGGISKDIIKPLHKAV
ncbi:site-specific integrase [Larkinella ripae]